MKIAGNFQQAHSKVGFNYRSPAAEEKGWGYMFDQRVRFLLNKGEDQNGLYFYGVNEVSGLSADELSPDAESSIDTEQLIGQFSAPAAESISVISVASGLSVTIANGSLAEIYAGGSQSATFAGQSGTLVISDAVNFSGTIYGLAGTDTLDLKDISFGPDTTATFLGTQSGGTLTVSDGTSTAEISLAGDYLSSTWDVSSDGSGGTNVVDPVEDGNWQALGVEAGGFLTGMDIAPNGTIVVRTDTYGAYIWNGTEWQQLVTSTSMPAQFIAADAIQNASQGVYEIQIAPSDTSIMYMMYEGYVFKTVNGGTNWTVTPFAPVTENTQDNYRSDGQKIAIDPNNPNIVYVGTPEGGLFVSQDGGTTWHNVAAVPISATDGSGNYPGIDGIEFDPALGQTNGNTNVIFAASWGNGVYESTNAGATWSLLSDSPTDVTYAAVSNSGIYYAVDNNAAGSSLWSFANGTWTELFSGYAGYVQSVAVNPSNPSEIVFQAGSGVIQVSYNGGQTWSGYAQSTELESTDVPWLTTTNTFMTVGATEFDPAVPNELISSAGVGVWTTTISASDFTSSTNVVWTSQSLGINQLVANEIIVPPGGNPLLASWDRAFFDVNEPTESSSSYGPNTGSTLTTGWSIDYASSDPSFIVGIADYYGIEDSGYSTDGGETWTTFASFPQDNGAIGGTIAASSPTDIIWAPAGGIDPYYTLNGGVTWNTITLPGVSNWGGFDWAPYLDTRTVAADRVLPNTFYLYDPTVGLFESTNGGVSWTENYTGSISQADYYNSELETVPGEAGNLFFTAGPMSGPQPDSIGFYESTNQGTTWTAVANVTDVSCFGFGAAAPGESYPAIYIVGWVNNVYGVWQSINDARSWTQIGTYPTGSLDQIKTIAGDPNNYGQVYIGFAGEGYAYLSAAPVVTSVATSLENSTEVPGNTITFTLTLSDSVTVAGAPTLSLNDGGTASYVGGSGSNSLVFSYTVSSSDTSVTSLAITGVNEPDGTTILDSSSGATASLSGAITSFSGLQIDTAVPAITSVVTSGGGVSSGSGDLDAGKTVTLTANFSEVVSVAGGTPTLSLNDGGTAAYASGSGTTALTFTYTVAAGQNTPDLTVTGVNLNSATVTDGAGNAANLSGAVTNPSGTLQIETTAPTVSAVTTLGSGVTSGSGDLDAGKTVTLTLSLSEAVSVSGGTPTLSLNDGGTATYASGSGTTALTFSYTVAAGQNTPDLTVTGVNLNSATVIDGAGNAANLSGAVTNPTGTLQIDTTAPTVSSVTTSGSGITSGSGDLDAGKTVTLTVNFSEAVSVAGGAPTLSLNDGGTATYASGSGTAALTFTYNVAGGQNTPDLTVTGVNLNSATITDAAGNAANLAGAAINPAGTLQIDTTPPTIASVTTSGSGITSGAGDLDAGKTVTLTVNFSTVVSVAGGAPTLSLNDGGTATYASGSGTAALTFTYNVVAGQNTPDLTVTGVNLNSATITDAAGNAANLAGAAINPAGTLQIDTTPPTIASVTTSGSGITSGAGDLDAGKTVTLTVNFSTVVSVAGSTPTLSLNDGGSATYTGGSGSTALTFTYNVAGGQNTPDLTVTGVNLNSATITDTAGNAANLAGGVANPAGTLQIDTTAPAAPVITSDNVNSNSSVTLTGTSEANGSVTIYDNSASIGTTTANTSGAWSFTTGVLLGGTQAFDATAMDTAGNISASSSVVDPAIIAAPSILSYSASTLSGSTQLNLVGTAVANSTVTVFDAAGELGTATTTATGTWNFATGSLSIGSYSFTATDTVAGEQTAASAPLNVTLGQPAGTSVAAATSADLITNNQGVYTLYNIGNNEILSATVMTQIGTQWQLVGFGDFNGTDSTDMLMRNSATGALELYDANNNTITGSVPMGQVGLEWSVVGFGDFSGQPNQTDMLMRDQNTGALELYDISNNQYTGFYAMGQVGLEWNVIAIGDFTGNANETDMLMQNQNTGAIEGYDITDNEYTGFYAMGQVGLEWQVVGVGNFSGQANQTDMLMQNKNTGALELYDMSNNQYTGFYAAGQIGLGWQAIGVGDFSGNANESDLLMQNKTTGALEYYNITNNALTAAAQLVQSAAAFASSGVIDTSGVIPALLNNQQAMITTPHH
jgi:Bacterial Ig domain